MVVHDMKYLSSYIICNKHESFSNNVNIICCIANMFKQTMSTALSSR